MPTGFTYTRDFATNSGQSSDQGAIVGGSGGTGLYLPNYMVGKNASACIIQCAYPNANGQLTLTGSAIDIAYWGMFDTFEFEGDAGLREISPVNAWVENNQPTRERWTVSLGAITMANGYNTAKLGYAVSNYFRVETQIAPPGGTPGKFVAIGVRDSYRDAIVEDKNGGVLTIKPCGIPFWYGTGTPPF